MPGWIWSPRGHWRLLAFCSLVVLAVLAFQGFATHTVGASSEPAGGQGAIAPLAGSRPVLAARGSRLVSIEPPPGRRIALTFDDGPDPRWTGRIAGELRAAHVHATFFEIGSQVARYPGLVHELVRDGNEIGNHTFTHVLLSGVPAWQRRLQLGLTEAAIAGVTGHYARLIRPPYSATPDAVTPLDERVLAQLAGRRYYIVLANFDSEDWKRPGVPAILRNASPPGTTGGIIMLHDGGGDRRQTVRALPLLIGQLRARGFRFVTVSQLAGLAPGVAAPVARGWSSTRGSLFVFSVRVAYLLTGVFSIILIVVGVLIGARILLLLVFATHHVRTSRARPDAEHLPSVTIVVPAYNEEVGIERAVRSLAASDYPDFEVLVVDDGSTDRTAEIVAGLELDGVQLVRQDNAGKAAALNTGIELSESEIVVMVDGDTLFEPDTVRRLIQPLADPEVAAVSGNTKVGNRGGLLGRWQHIEYVIGFNLDRRMYEVLQCTPTVPGAAGAFRRSVLVDVGGVPGDTLAEDTDLTLTIGRTGRRVVYAQDARAWTEAPATLTALWRQRYRWSFGTMQAVYKHRGAIVSRDPRQRRIGRRALPYMLLFQIILPIVSPLIDLFSIYGLVFTGAERTLIVWGAFNCVQLLIAVYGFKLDRESLRPLWALPLQQFVYRQLMYLVIIESSVSALQGARSGWKHLPRTGDVVIGASEPS
ncbi:MAG TPA: bifunctional polysaccharide deacetylase/glycosyltransferase family 2 protein [Solirubrobacteraceae bacterium]|nr:bifunctional polysaccharide deacetylase/glycosyltransferase family 2 protein [Solirubrobacteraceae bacterium]